MLWAESWGPRGAAAGPMGLPPAPLVLQGPPLCPSPHLNHLNSQLSSPKARPSPCPLVGAGYPLPCQPVCRVGFPPPGVTLPTQKRLSDTPQGLRGYKWRQRSRPYIPWAPTTVQLWEAYRLLRREGEWATPGVCYISEGSSRRSAAKPSLRWECTLCPQLVSSKADGRGHHQSSHLGRQCSSPLCNCPTASRGFNSCTVLAKHLDLQHNVDPTMVQQVPPFVYWKYIDRVAADPHHRSPPLKSINVSSPGPSHNCNLCTCCLNKLL